MRKFIAAAAAALVLTTAPVAFAAEYTKGQVTKVDAKQKKVTIKHGELKNLGMPAMTMVFVAANDALLEKVKPGQDIEFTADRVNGRITLTDVK